MAEILLVILLIAVTVLGLTQIRRRVKRGSACCGEHEETVKRTSVKDKNKAHYPYEVELKIGGMTCGNCARKVENALNGMEGVLAKVDISSHSARVHLKEKPDQRQLAQAVAEAGYAVIDFAER